MCTTLMKKIKKKNWKVKSWTTSLFTLIETGHSKYDFIFFLKKKKTGWLEDDFTFNVVLHTDDLTLFYKKKNWMNLFLQIWLKIDPEIQKSRSLTPYSVSLFQSSSPSFSSFFSRTSARVVAKSPFELVERSLHVFEVSICFWVLNHAYNACLLLWLLGNG